MTAPTRKALRIHIIALGIILAIGGYLRASGLYRGLREGIISHPDSPKQVHAFYQYMQGEYIHYRNSLFYDGYPYGLNRADELLLRLAQSVRRPLLSWLNAGARVPWTPNPRELFWWGRSFRVFYGMLVIGLVFAAARRWGAPPWAALCAAALYALAPLGAVVSHAVTGDIGVDLFLSLGLWALTLSFDRGRLWYLLLYGFACGMAFAAKYHGAMGLGLGATAFLLCARLKWKSLRLLMLRGICAGTGFLLGALAGIPVFLINPKTTWRNIRLNLFFIRDYGASGEILSQPVATRVLTGFRHNLPLAFFSLGFFFVLLVVVSAAVATAHYVRLRRSSGEFGRAEENPHRQAALWVSIALFPIVSTLIFAGLKLESQPFHFSYNLPVMAVSFACLSSYLVRMKTARMLLLLIFCGTVCESTFTSVREDYFWRREEISGEARRFAGAVFNNDGRGAPFAPRHPKLIKQFYIEPARLPVFRNRPSILVHSDAEWWRDVHQLPVPSVPWQKDAAWVFMNGPVFPRNDRMFVVPASGPGHQTRVEDEINPGSPPWICMTNRRDGVWSQRTLVFNRKPDTLVLGLRTGRYPARYEMRVPGASHAGLLLPHSQKIVRMENARYRLVPPAQHPADPTFLLPLDTRSQLGPVWVTILEGPQEQAIYERYGPVEPSPAPEPPQTFSAEELSRRLSGLRYLEGNQVLPLPSKSVPLRGDQTVVAAGAYELVARLVNTGEPQTIRLEWVDPFGYPSGVRPFEAVVGPGLQEIRWKFVKSFQPYDPILYVTAERESLTLLSWELKPDAAALASGVVSDMDAADTTGMRLYELNVVYPGFGRIRGILLPESVQGNAHLRYAVLMDLDERIDHRELNEAVIFLHLKDAEGREWAMLDFLMLKASFSRSAIAWQSFDLAKVALPPGTYHIDGGLYNGRTRRRHRFEAAPDIESDPGRRFFRWATFVVP